MRHRWVRGVALLQHELRLRRRYPLSYKGNPEREVSGFKPETSQIRSEGDSNPRGGLPHQPHFQTDRAGCTERHGRASRIRNPNRRGHRWAGEASCVGSPLGPTTGPSEPCSTTAAPCSGHPVAAPQGRRRGRTLNRTLVPKWAHVRRYASNPRRSWVLTTWLHIFNHHRAHSSLGKLLPAQYRGWALQPAMHCIGGHG